MIQLKRILFPTDFSKRAAEAALYACDFVETFGAELHLLHVIEPHLGSTPQLGMGLAIPKRVEETEQEANQALDEVLEKAWGKERSVVKAVVKGEAFVEIIRYAKTHDIDLIVMATHGRTGLEHVLIGSVAERVVRKAPCPVLTVRPAGQHFVRP